MTLDGISMKQISNIVKDTKGETEEENNCVATVSKQRKTRRGKKKRHKSVGDDDDQLSSSKQIKLDDQHQNIDSKISKEQSRLEAIEITKKKRKLSSVIIRPIHVPKAPENSTQFIIDDHEDSQLYIDFEKPFDESKRKYKADLDFKNFFNSPKETYDAAFQDIDYEYESPDDLDTTAFYAKDFEIAYFKARFDELMQMPQEQLIDMYHHLEQQVVELQDQLVQYDPMFALDNLQQELLTYQEENKTLRHHHKQLKKELNNINKICNCSEESSSEDHLQELLTDDESEVNNDISL